MFDLLIKTPLTNLLLIFYHFLGGNLGFSIILFTIFIRFIMLPLTIRQIRFQKKMSELQPRLQELQANRKDAKQMSGEEMALMKQTAGSCVTGCLPFAIQLPIFFGLYGTIRRIATSSAGDVFNKIVYFDWLKHDATYRFNTHFLGFDLALSPSKVGWVPQIAPYIILLLLLVSTQFLQGKMMAFSQNKKKALDIEKKKANQKKLSAKEKEKAESQEEMQKMMQMQTKYMIPLLIGVGSYTFSAALSLYILTQNIFGIIQTYIQNRSSDGKPLMPDFISNKGFRQVDYTDVKDTVNDETANLGIQSDYNSNKKKRNKKKNK